MENLMGVESKKFLSKLSESRMRPELGSTYQSLIDYDKYSILVVESIDLLDQRWFSYLWNRIVLIRILWEKLKFI
jgi:hypothetical protein